MIATVHFLWRPINYTAAHQRYSQRDRTDRQTDRQRSDSIGQTVLQRSPENQLIAHKWQI